VRIPAAVRTELVVTALTTAAALVSFAVALLLPGRGDGALAVLAVVVVLSVSRAARRHPLGVTQLLALPPLGVLAAAVGALMAAWPAAGDPLFVAVMAGAVWLRRFGARAARIGTLAALPFVAMLVTPVPPGHGPGQLLRAALVSAVAVATVAAIQPLLRRLSPATAPAPARPRAGRRLSPATRMAAQLAVALGAALLAGRLLFPGHWPWLVLSAYLVNAGAAGRGDVAHKAVLRLAGAAGGTVLATLLAAAVPAHRPGTVVAIFAVLAVAAALRAHSYTWWAAGVTTALSLLYGYYGRAAPTLLADRLAAIALGAALGVAAAWLVLPIRSRDVLRRRVADALAALTDYLTIAGQDPSGLPGHSERVQAALGDLERIRPALAAQHRLTPARLVRRGRPHPVHAVTALLDCRPALTALTSQLTANPADARLSGALRRLRADVGSLRRALAAREPAGTAEPTAPHPALADLHRAVAAVGAALAGYSQPPASAVASSVASGAEAPSLAPSPTISGGSAGASRAPASRPRSDAGTPST
jgi:hypothetical protein